MNENCWLPELMVQSDYEDWQHYYDAVYGIFHSDFIEDHPYFESKKVVIRKYPIEHGREDAFFHVTCQDYYHQNDRAPDFRRCERIRWVRKFIENYNCDPSLCEDCEGVKIWAEPYHSTERVHLLLEEERYLVVLERRRDYILLITAYYVDQDHSLDKLVRRWMKNRAS